MNTSQAQVCKDLSAIINRQVNISKLKFSFFTLLFTLFCSISVGQVSLQLNPHTYPTFKSNDVWSMVVVNNKSESVQSRFEANILSQGKLVVKLQSNTVSLVPGVSIFGPSNLQTSRIVYIDPSIGTSELRLGHLPSADYDYCVRIVCVESPQECAIKLNSEMQIEDCEQVASELNSPLILTIPDDEAEIEEKRPMFSWIPPMPIGGDPEIRYTVILVKMLKDQLPEEAINRNRILMKREGVSGVSLAYPAELNDLVEGESYAWKVEALMGNLVVARSEVWEFKIKKIETVKYVRLSPKPNSAMYKYKEDGTIYFTLTGNYQNNDFNMEILGIEGSTKIKNIQKDIEIREASLSESKHTGFNTFKLSIQDEGLSNGVYQLKCTNTTGDIFSMNFIVEE
jgi:hypothetical protein